MITRPFWIGTGIAALDFRFVVLAVLIGGSDVQYYGVPVQIRSFVLDTDFSSANIWLFQDDLLIASSSLSDCFRKTLGQTRHPLRSFAELNRNILCP